MDWASFLKSHNLGDSISRRGDGQDNAVTERISSLLTRERIRRRTYRSRGEARKDAFDHIERFYNPIRKHVRYAMLSPVNFERQQYMSTEGVLKTQGYSHHLFSRQFPAHRPASDSSN